MYDVSLLKAFIDQAEEVAQRDGNVGRKVLRCLQSVFSGHQAQFQLVVPTTSNLVFAYVLEQVSSTCIFAQAAANEFAHDTVSFCIVRDSLAAKTAKVVVSVSTFPESMRARQALLMALAAGLRRILALGLVRTLPRAAEEVLQTLFETPQSVEELLQHEARFNQLVAGQYDLLDQTALPLVSLASRVNSEVYLAVAASDQLYEKMVAEAPAY